jgi:DNA repair protein RecN (Recombination protein N)
VEGIFDTEGNHLINQFLKDNDLDTGEELVIRREIALNGKSRAFVNDTPVNLDQLRTLSGSLVDLHQQFDTLELGQSAFQRSVLDALAGNLSLLRQYQEAYEGWQAEKRLLQDLVGKKKEFSATFDYNKFLYDELTEAAFGEDELEHADAELKLLGNAEAVKAALDKVCNSLKEGEQPMVQHLKSMQNLLHPFGTYHPELPDLLKRMQSVQIELDDISGELERINNHLQFEPGRLEQLSERLALGYKLLKKHGLRTTAQLAELRQELGAKLEAVLNIDDSILAAEKKTAASHQTATGLASRLNAQRNKQVKPLEDNVNALLRQVGMPNARLKVNCTALAQLGPDGADQVEFLFDANKSNRLVPLGKVASGGELSRLMLCIKSLVAESLDLPTMIFDEIDTGISGEAARQVGIIMKNLARSRQLISITHQPQIAGKADAHFFVYKENRGDQVRTAIRELDTEERISAIARMMSGEKPTAAALQNAREMVMK